MAIRNGTYIAFHANDQSNPADSDIKYFNLLKAWKVRSDSDFSFINSHDKVAAVRDSSKTATLAASLRTRLNASKHLLLVIGDTTRADDDWVPFEIEYAVDTCGIPIIAAYPTYKSVLDPGALSRLWPRALADRINARTARVIHIPFRQQPIVDAIGCFSHLSKPNGPLVYYTEQAHRSWGLL